MKIKRIYKVVIFFFGVFLMDKYNVLFMSKYVFLLNYFYIRIINNVKGI